MCRRRGLPRSDCRVVARFLARRGVSAICSYAFGLCLPRGSSFRGERGCSFPVMTVSLDSCGAVQRVLNCRRVSLRRSRFAAR